MDHAVKATRGRPLNTLRFENDELECLYQRYTLKLQRFSVLGVVALVVVLCGVMAALSFTFNNAATFHVSIDGWAAKSITGEDSYSRLTDLMQAPKQPQ